MASRAEAQRRALTLFEQIIDGCDPHARVRLLEHEPPEVLRLLTGLEATAGRARRNFPTEEDVHPDRAPMPLPERIGAYRLTELIGDGGMGLVFRGQRDDGLFEHAVAVKLIHPDRFSRAAQSRFEAERRLLARLDHPSIARLIDGGVDPLGWPYLLMELIEGGRLDDWMEERRPGAEAAVGILAEIVEGVQAAHRALVIHGDLKPANIMITHGGRVRILDFGVGRFADAPDAGELEPRTERYSSPQRRAGMAPTILDDVYALGRILDELLGDGRDRDLDAIVARATAEAPDRRYPSAEALGADLDRWRSRRPVRARPQTRVYVAERFLARRRLAVIASVVMAGALIAISAVALAGWRTAQGKQREAELRLAEAHDLARLQLDATADQDSAVVVTVSARAAAARRMQDLLDRLGRSAQDNRPLRHDIAEGLWRLAAIQSSAGRPSLGDTDAAARNLDRAERVLEPPSGTEDRKLLVHVLMDRAELAMNRLQDLKSARARLDQADRLLRGDFDPALRVELNLSRADYAVWAGQFDAAKSFATLALGQMPPTDGSEAAIGLHARALGSLGEALWYAGHEAASVPIYRRQVDLLTQQARSGSNNRALRWRLAEARWNLGVTLTGLGEARAALAPLTSARATMDAEALADPDDREAWRRHSITTLAYGQALAASGRFAQGRRLLEQTVDERKARFEERPTETGRARDFAIAAAALGDALAQKGDIAMACSVYRQAAGVFADLAAKGRLIPLDQAHGQKLEAEAQAAHCG